MRPVDRVALAALAGTLFGRAQWPGFEWAAWLAMGPLWLAAAGQSPGRAALHGGLCGLLGGLHLYGMASYGLAFFAGVWLYCAAAFGAAAALLAWARGPGAPAPSLFEGLIAAAAWTGCEALRMVGSVALPMSLGASQSDFPRVIQIASTAGALAVSLLVAWGGCVAAQLLVFGRRALGVAALFALLVGAVLLSGSLRLARADAPTRAGALVVGGVAAGAPDAMHRLAVFDLTQRRALEQRYLAQSAVAHARGATVLVWPEHAFFGELEAGREEQSPLVRFARASGLDLLAGVVRKDALGRRFNAAVAIANREPVRVMHDKVLLAPLVESDLHAGEGLSAAPLPVPGPARSVGVLLCLESLFPQLAAALAWRGARWLAVLSSDSGFGLTPIAEVHARRAVMRAVETGRPLLRVARGGVTMAVDALGRVQERVAPHAAGAVLLVVGEQTLAPPALHVGRGLGWLCLALCVALGVARARARRSQALTRRAAR